MGYSLNHLSFPLKIQVETFTKMDAENFKIALGSNFAEPERHFWVAIVQGQM